MRAAFVKKLMELAQNDDKLAVVTPDMGFSVFEKFRESFPNRFYNTGIAEQSSVGISAGLALAGKTVYLYSIVPFVTMRPFEQVRVDVCYQNLPVKLVGSGGGLTYGTLGPTHHSIEDMAVMRALPNMSILCPGDPIEAELCTELSYRIAGPCYLRLGKGSGEPIVHQTRPKLEIGKMIKLMEGNDAIIISTGNMLKNTKIAVEMLKDDGINCTFLSCPVIKPFDSKFMVELLEKRMPIFTIEEHSIFGGLGTAVAEIMAETESKSKLTRIGLADRFVKEVGSQDYLRKINGLAPEDIAGRIRKGING